jgi:hypothetical protein
MAAALFCVTGAIYFALLHPHMADMVAWQKTNFTREPPKSKAELRQMLTEAVRNTQASTDPEPKRQPKIDKIAAAVE